MKISTLCFLVKGDQILLAKKKRGFGVGKWNGVGGKVEGGESIPAATIRELREEIGVRGEEADLKEMGVLKFRSGNRELDWDAHLYFLDTWTGDPVETEEMSPQWYNVGQLPFGEMWPDDRHWFPYILADKRIEGNFSLDPSGKEILDFKISEI